MTSKWLIFIFLGIVLCLGINHPYKMSEWLDNQTQSDNSIRHVLQERIEKANPRRELTAEGTKCRPVAQIT